MKQCGILLHISSLSTPYGIGDLGPAAYQFADYLAEKGHSYWQILPLNHPGYGNSPYNPLSAFAFNKYLISPQLLHEKGYLSARELDAMQMDTSSFVDFDKVMRTKDAHLELAARRMLKDVDIAGYIEDNSWHLKPYLAFMLLSRLQESPQWYFWPTEYRRYTPQLYERLYQDYPAEMLQTAALQYIFEEQLKNLKDYLNQKQIRLIGDIPIYLSYESAELWAHQELFDLDEAGMRQSLAGVPPDAFAETGQLWGNPIYDWERMQEQGFQLFIRRFAQLLKYLDLLRLDHFIGYVNYWQVPVINGHLPETAQAGHWQRAVPEAFFGTILQHFDAKRFIAEDLGILNADVCGIRDRIGLPGMIILQFCFEEGVPEVQSYPAHRFIYTGTHDNSTSRGWFNALPENSVSRLNLAIFCKRYLPHFGLPNEENIHQILIEIARISGCDNCIVPMQDILALDDEARMNIPGTALGNWHWRMQDAIIS